MKIIGFLVLLRTLAGAGLWISIGILISKHMDTVLALIIRKPIPEDLIKPRKLDTTYQVIKWIGIFIIITGIGIAVTGIATLIVSFSMPSANLNFNL